MTLVKYFKKESVLDLFDYFSVIKKYNYVLSKIDTPHFNEYFPNTYPIGKDLDIFVSREDFSKFVEETKKFCYKYNFFDIDISNENENNVRFRFVKHKKLHFQLDVKINDNLVEKSEINQNGLKITNKYNETLIRISEIIKNPHKKHHKDWLNKSNIFCGFLWPPCEKYWDEIIQNIEIENSILSKRIIKFDNKKDLHDFVCKVYETDDVDINKVKNIKIKSFESYSFSVYFFVIDVKENSYRNKNNGNKISINIEKLKKKLRKRYSNLVENYKHDIIIHMTDNISQSIDILKIVENINYD